MPPRPSSTVDVLSHLTSCKKCGYYVGTPVLCKGQSDPTKKGYWFEKCLNNEKPVPDTCDYFAWRKDLPRGKVTGGQAKKSNCPGALCRQADKRNTINAECPEAPEPAARGRGGKRAKGGPKKPAVEPSPEPVEVPERVDPKPNRGPPKRSSYATPTGPAYQVRMSALDAEHRLEEEGRANRARQEQAKSHLHVITLRWWIKDGEDPEVVEIAIENPSAFHPKDIPLLVEEYHCDREKFQYYDSKRRVWYTGSNGTAPRDLSKLADDDLCYRTFGVTWGESMPGGQKKRPAPDESPAHETPRRPRPPFAEYPITPSSSHRRSLSPTATTPPRSGSSTFLDDTQLDPFSNGSQFDFSFTPFTNELPALSANQESFTPIPALFPTEPDIPRAGESSSPAQPLNLTPAPRGRSGWPWKYVCDMAQGFDAMRLLEDAQPPTSTADAFKIVFQAQYKYSTYRDQLRAWRAAGKHPGERARWINLGREEGGEWGEFMRRWRA
ncbi:hypothetical protein LXA43DRAFT_1097205 [Ganoderma leucocontextum]|nr:hypothetical protein LXA43DRAFT_1097205 [Ganoderma leucocontextum]